MIKIAVDKFCVDKIKPIKEVEYIYVFNHEPYEDLIALNMHCVYYKKCNFVDINLTEYPIDCIKKSNINEPDYYILPERVDYKLGIIIPNCNYADCLEKCFNSILNQTYQNFEIIFIDDVSTDNSLEIATRFKERYKDKFKIVPLKQKRLNGGARNEGYLYLSDDVDYVYYIDSDDWLIDENVFQKIVDRLQNKPDVLFVGIAEYKNGKTTISKKPEYKDRYEALQGWSGSCGKVIKKSLATRQECLYNEGTLKEDKNQHCRICIYMRNFKLLREPVYVWNRENYKSVTTIRDEIVWGTSTIRHYADTKQLYLSVRGQDEKIDEILENRLALCKDEIMEGKDRQW